MYDVRYLWPRRQEGDQTIEDDRENRLWISHIMPLAGVPPRVASSWDKEWPIRMYMPRLQASSGASGKMITLRR